jgi:uncharacterized protein (DUF1684 family)
MAALVLALGMLLATVGQTPPASYRAEIERFRADREAELKADDGWLTVVGLFWLKPGANTAGGARGNDMALPSKAPARLGVFQLIGSAVTFIADSSASVMRGGRPVTTVSFDFAAGDRGAIATGDLVLFPIQRGDRVGIRMRDLQSAMRRGFKGINYFPLRPEYRVTAKFTAYPEPRKVPVPNVLGQTPEMTSPGYVTFTIGGRSLRLEPVYETDERRDLFFIFNDLTSRDATYPAGRFLYAPLPANGVVVLDFNRAINPPCAFTDFATCPLPTKPNRLPVRIEAGELAYHGPTR